MRIELDADSCIGNGMCCALAPKHFDIDAEGVLTVTNSDVDLDDSESVEDAVASCPVGALRLI